MSENMTTLILSTNQLTYQHTTYQHFLVFRRSKCVPSCSSLEHTPTHPVMDMISITIMTMSMISISILIIIVSLSHTPTPPPPSRHRTELATLETGITCRVPKTRIHSWKKPYCKEASTFHDTRFSVPTQASGLQEKTDREKPSHSPAI